MTKRLALLCLPLAVLFGCPKAQPTPGQGVHLSPEEERGLLEPKVDPLERRAEAVLRAQDELVWKNWTEGAVEDMATTYQGTDTLFSADAIHAVARLRALTADPQRVRALTHLQNYLVGEYLARSTLDLTDAIANLEAGMTFTVEGRDYAYRDLDRLLANEKSATKRHEMWAAATPDVQRVSELLSRRSEQLESLVLGLGYPSYEAFGAEMRQADLTQLGLLADQVLTLTQAPYTAMLARLSDSELELPVGKMERSDIPRLFRPHGVDAFFPRSQILARAQQTLAGMGFDLVQLKNLHLDLKDSPKKNARALTLPVVVPSDIRVSMRLQGGIRDQRALFHELGHALHDGLTQEHDFALGKLGNSTVAEAFSYLFEDLVEDPVWLEQMAGLSGEKLNTYLAEASAHQLYLLRRAAGRLLYQLDLHRGVSADSGAVYKAVMERSYGLPLRPEDVVRAVVEQDSYYASADYFRAWCLAGQLEAQLKTRFGPAWWKSRAAGDFLRKLWAPGNAISAPELARAIGETGVKPDALLLRLGATLQIPITLPGQPPAPSPSPDGGQPEDRSSAAAPAPSGPAAPPAPRISSPRTWSERPDAGR